MRRKGWVQARNASARIPCRCRHGGSGYRATRPPLPPGMSASRSGHDAVFGKPRRTATHGILDQLDLPFMLGTGVEAAGIDDRTATDNLARRSPELVRRCWGRHVIHALHLLRARTTASALLPRRAAAWVDDAVGAIILGSAQLSAGDVPGSSLPRSRPGPRPPVNDGKIVHHRACGHGRIPADARSGTCRPRRLPSKLDDHLGGDFLGDDGQRPGFLVCEMENRLVTAIDGSRIFWSGQKDQRFAK